jgi:hypothetical protein
MHSTSGAPKDRAGHVANSADNNQRTTVILGEVFFSCSDLLHISGFCYKVGDRHEAAEAHEIWPKVIQQLGLKLESGRGPVEVLVVDRLDKPTEN